MSIRKDLAILIYDSLRVTVAHGKGHLLLLPFGPDRIHGIPLHRLEDCHKSKLQSHVQLLYYMYEENQDFYLKYYLIIHYILFLKRKYDNRNRNFFYAITL